MTTWIVLAIMAVGIGVPFWRWALRPLLPLEGMSKAAFVLGCWWAGGWMTYGALAHQLYYWLPALLIGLGLLAWGCLLAWEPFHRYRRDRAMFRTRPPVAVPWLQPEDKAA